MQKKLNFFLILFLGILIGFNAYFLFKQKDSNSVVADNLSFDEQEATIRAIQKAMPSVVSILVYEELEASYINPQTEKEEKFKQKEKRGEGTGFIISEDGLILTNKHVVNATRSRIPELKVVLNDGTQVLANLVGKDPAHDLAVLKIGQPRGSEHLKFPFLELADSSKLQVGATVIAIGNSLGLYKNSATKGIVSGLGRALSAGDNFGKVETFDNLIQTDAEINIGNSGGPLINLEGRVVGVNVAIDRTGTAIGFAIPANDVRPAVLSVRERGKIVRPQLGVRYLMINHELMEEEGLSRANGAWIVKKEGEETIISGSPANKAGLEPGDIIFEVNAIKIDGKNNLFSVIQNYKPGDRIGLKIQRGDKIMIKIVTLGEF